MTTKEITDRIQHIKDISGDYELAHSEEDSLRVDFIGYVATLANPSLAEKARLVLSTKEIQFERWCA